jgi:hypothetical protein
VPRAIVPQTKLKKEKNSHVVTNVMVIQERDQAAGPSTSIPHCCYSAEKMVLQKKRRLPIHETFLAGFRSTAMISFTVLGPQQFSVTVFAGKELH